MKYKQLTRLFIEEKFAVNTAELSSVNDIHYLLKVMRKKIGDKILIFNGIDGEYLAEITSLDKNKILFSLLEKTQNQTDEKEINLIFAPIKHPRILFLLEKATELGVTKFIPIITKHSVVDKINLDKWKIYIKEASEQCRRITVPNISPVQTLNKFLSTWNSNNQIILCNEIEKTLSFYKAAKDLQISNIMIGPEGGFSQEELLSLSQIDFITSAHLGNRILRAETAAITALAIVGIDK